MQLPSIDRTPHARPSGVDVASPGAVMPVAPVNPSVHHAPRVEQAPSVINKISPEARSQAEQAVQTSAPDPTRRGTEAATAPKDWTIHRPEPEKVENPPPKPLYQVLMDHIKKMWTAGASAIQVEQVKDQLTPPPQVSPTDMPGNLAKEVLVYSPHTIKKTEKL